MIFHVRSSIVMLPWVSGSFLPGIMPSVHLVTVGVILCPSSSEMKQAKLNLEFPKRNMRQL